MSAKKHCRVLPGSYCEVHNEPSPSNTMVTRNHDGIALGPTGNLQGSVKFYCLNTGQVLKRRDFTELPMSDSIIKRVDAIGKKKKQGRKFRFLNRKKLPFSWTDEVPKDDKESQGLLEEEAPFPDVNAKLPGVDLERDQVGPNPAVEDEPEPAFEARAAEALTNANIRMADQLVAARAVTAPLVEAESLMRSCTRSR